MLKPSSLIMGRMLGEAKRRAPWVRKHSKEVVIIHYGRGEEKQQSCTVLKGSLRLYQEDEKALQVTTFRFFLFYTTLKVFYSFETYKLRMDVFAHTDEPVELISSTSEIVK